MLFVERRIFGVIERGGRGRGVVIVTPFCEMVCKFKPGDVGRGILKVNDNELFVFV